MLFSNISILAERREWPSVSAGPGGSGQDKGGSENGDAENAEETRSEKRLGAGCSDVAEREAWK